MDPKLKPALPDRRARHPVCLDARLTRADGTTSANVVSDLSLDGCCVTGVYRIGEAVTLHVPRIGTLTGQVRWSIGNRSGVRFTRQPR